jgi:hypothetical protein
MIIVVLLEIESRTSYVSSVSEKCSTARNVGGSLPLETPQFDCISQYPKSERIAPPGREKLKERV